MMTMEKHTSDILKILEQDARTSPAQIAIMTGMTEAEVRTQIAALEQNGIIKRYRTVINWEKAGREQVYAFIDVKVIPSRGAGFDDVAERIYRFPEVMSVYLVSGEYDLRVIVVGDNIREVSSFVSDKLAPIDKVQATVTHFVLKRYKEDGEVFEEPLDDRRLPVAP
jgi:DNA-binding Lrp family transcriptional regulator